MRCICSHRHNPDTPRHTRRHPNIDTEPKTDTLLLWLMSEGGGGQQGLGWSGGLKGAEKGAGSFRSPLLVMPPRLPRLPSPTVNRSLFLFKKSQKAENGESLNFDTWDTQPYLVHGVGSIFTFPWKNATEVTIYLIFLWEPLFMGIAQIAFDTPLPPPCQTGTILPFPVKSNFELSGSSDSSRALHGMTKSAPNL